MITAVTDNPSAYSVVVHDQPNVVCCFAIARIRVMRISKWIEMFVAGLPWVRFKPVQVSGYPWC